MSPELWQRFVTLCDALIRGEAALVQLPGSSGPLGIVCVLRDTGEAIEAQPVASILTDCPSPLRFDRTFISRFEPGRN
jgi:hypothetical protein